MCEILFGMGYWIDGEYFGVDVSFWVVDQTPLILIYHLYIKASMIVMMNIW